MSECVSRTTRLLKAVCVPRLLFILYAWLCACTRPVVYRPVIYLDVNLWPGDLEDRCGLVLLAERGPRRT